MTNKLPEKSVEDIVMEHCEPDTGLLTIGKHDHDVLREIIKAERQRCEEMVKAERAKYADLFCFAEEALPDSLKKLPADEFLQRCLIVDAKEFTLTERDEAVREEMLMKIARIPKMEFRMSDVIEALTNKTE